MEYSSAGTFAKQDQSNDLEVATLQGRLSETRLSEASLFDDNFFDTVMRESLDGGVAGRERESFDGGLRADGGPPRTSVDQGIVGRGSLDYGFRGSLDMRGSLDIRASDLRGSIDQGYMTGGFFETMQKEIGFDGMQGIKPEPGHIYEPPIAPDGSVLPPALSVQYMSQYSCAQNPMIAQQKVQHSVPTNNGGGSSLTLLHSQQQPAPNFMGGVYSQSQFQSQFIMPTVSPPMPQPPMQQFMQNVQSAAQSLPQQVKQMTSGFMKKSGMKTESQPKRSTKKKGSDPKSSKGSNNSQSMSHDCNSGTTVTSKTSSYRGVSKASTNSWGAKFSGKRIKSTCKSEQEAAEVYDEFLRKHRPDLFTKLANFCPQCGADRIKGPQCMCLSDMNAL